MLQKPGLAITWLLAVNSGIGSVGLQKMRVHRILQIDPQHVITQTPDQGRILDREHNLDPAIKVTAHEIRRAKVDFMIAAVPEIENTAMFEETADDRSDSNRIT